MENYELRQNSKNFFKANTQQFVFALILIFLVTISFDAIERLFLMTYYQIPFTFNNFIQYNTLVDVVETQFNVGAILISLLINIIPTLISIGLSLAVLKGIDQGEFFVKDIFNVFKLNWGVLLTMVILIQVIVTFLSILIIPGIIASYSLAMSVYIFYDRPINSAIKSMKESHAQMKGKRLKLFMLQLYYLAWILAVFLVAIVFVVINPILGIAALFVQMGIVTYLSVLLTIVEVNFYKENIRNLIGE